jgi:hypothetical protein
VGDVGEYFEQWNSSVGFGVENLSRVESRGSSRSECILGLKRIIQDEVTSFGSIRLEHLHSMQERGNLF